MITQTTAEAVAAQAAAGTTAATNEEADSALFQQELQSQMTETVKSAMNALTEMMEKLAAAFPGSTVSNRQQTTIEASGASISISDSMLKAMSENEDLFEKTKSAIEGLLTAASNQNLVSGDGTRSRNITVNDFEIRYAEVNRTANGTTMSISTLMMQHQNMDSDTIETLLGLNNSGDSSFNFESLLGSTSSWRLESMFTMRSMTRLFSMQGSTNSSLNFTNLHQMMQQSNSQRGQSSFVSIQVAIQEWSQANGDSTVSGMNFLAYIEMMGLSDPLVLDLADEGINLTSPEDGVVFDINGDGSPVQTSFIKGNNAFLYLDKNGNGVVDDANELFGDHGGFSSGFENLSQYDDNGDGIIDERDAIYSELRLWRDLNGDGVNQAEESMTLAEAGIQSINLKHDNSKTLDEHGNVIADRSTFTRTDGSQGTIADVWLRNNRN